MNLAEYKVKIKDLEVRLVKITKEHDRQQVLYEQQMAELEKLGITDVEEVDEKLESLKKEIEEKTETLDKYLTAFEAKITAIEELMK